MKNSTPTVTKASPEDHAPNKSFFDLRTSNGQILFLFVTIAISSLVQFIPFQSMTISLFTWRDNIITRECNVSSSGNKPLYWTFGRSNASAHLKHVHAVLDRLGLENGNNESEWDLLWAHDYPFRTLYPKLHNLRPHQKVNHFPACGFLTNKVDLATTNLKYIPKSFKLPKQKSDFLQYAEQYPDKLFVQKHNQHRHVYVRSIADIDFNDNNTFIQEFVTNPLLVDGHKFDIGVYVTITSVNPLRVYIYTGDVLFRYCPLKYYPFDAKLLDKYIVGDDYTPTWEIPALARYFNTLGYGMKDSFDGYMRQNGRDPSIIWKQVDDAVRMAVMEKEHHIADALKSFKSKRNFFEMMRFDLVVDDDLNVYLMEANMSPNLSSAHFAQNQLLYEQVIYNLLNLVGVGSSLHRHSFLKGSRHTEAMVSAEKNIAVDPEVCSQVPCLESCAPLACQLCLPCLSVDDLADLNAAYREHFMKGDARRLFPVSIVDEIQILSPKNQLHSRWFASKCKADNSWC